MDLELGLSKFSAQSAAVTGGYDVYSEKKRRDTRRAERKAEAGKTD